MAPLETTEVVTQVIESVSADRWEVYRLTIHNKPGNPTLDVYYRYGKHDEEVDATEWLGESMFSASAASLGQAKPDGTKTWYENLKALAYKVGQDAGHLPAGVVS